MLPRLQGSYCPSCGALVPEGADSCPKCGMWAKGSRARRRPRPQDRVVSQETSALPRIEPALPAEQDLKDPYLHEKPLRLRSVILAAVACVALVGGAVLYITHPWNPDAYSIKAKEPADTSQAGFPGVLDSLTGQDSDRGGEQEVKTGDENTYDQLKEAYVQLGELSSALDDSVDRLEKTGLSGDKDERTQGASEAEALGIQLSNLIAEVQDVDVTSGTYAESRSELLKLANYLRNRSDLLTQAWREARDSQDPEAERSQILQSVRGEASSYGRLFREGYAQFSLEAPASEG